VHGGDGAGLPDQAAFLIARPPTAAPFVYARMTESDLIDLYP
jgi:hypothetical protein